MMSNFRRLVAAMLVLCVASFVAANAFADEKADKDKAANDAMMAEMMKYAQPGPMHAALKTMEGKWKASVKTWTVPGGEPQMSEGVSDNRVMLGGRYLEQKYTGTMMGMPFEGYGLTGFDNKAQKVWGLWLDNMSTKGMVSEGTMSADGKTMTCTGVADGPDGKPMTYKTVTKIVDDKTHTFAMTTTEKGKDVPWMEITYTKMTGGTAASE
jgi:hypothetical protein